MKFAILFAFAFVSAVMGQAVKTPAKGDFRNEFDHLLVTQITAGMQRGEQQLLHLQTQIDQLNVSKSKALQDQIVGEIEIAVAFIQGGQATITRELTRTDLNILERFTFEDVQAVSAVLIKDLKEAETKVKAVKTA